MPASILNREAAMQYLKSLLDSYFERTEHEGEALAEDVRMEFIGAARMLAALAGQRFWNELRGALEAEGYEIVQRGERAPDE